MSTFTGTVYCPSCGEAVVCTAGLSSTGVRHDGASLRVSTTDATGRHKCKGSKE